MSEVRVVDERYLRLNVYENPFPVTGTPQRLWILATDSRRESFRTLLQAVSLAENGDVVGVRISGAYGQGKSHLFRHLEYELSKTPGKYLVVYTHSPTDFRTTPDAARIFHIFISKLGGRSFLRRLTAAVVSRVLYEKAPLIDAKRLFKKTGFFTKPEKQFSDLLEAVHAAPETLLNALDELNISYLKEEVMDRLGDRFDFDNPYARDYVDEGYVERMIDVMQRSHAYRAFIGQATANADEGLAAFKTVVNLARYVGHRAAVLLIDEVERIERHHMEPFLHTCSLLLEHGPRGLCLALACTPRVWAEILGIGREATTIVGPALARRMAFTITLEDLNIEDAVDLVAAYIRDVAVDPRLAPAPFSESGIEVVWREAGARPGDILVTCYMALEEAVRRGLDHVTEECVREAIARKRAGVVPSIRRPRLTPLPELRRRIYDDFTKIPSVFERSRTLGLALLHVLQKLQEAGRIDAVGTQRGAEYLIRVWRGTERIGVVVVAGANYHQLRVMAAPFARAFRRKRFHRLIIVQAPGTEGIDAYVEKVLRDRTRVTIKPIEAEDVATLLYATGVPTSYRNVELLAEEAIQLAELLGLSDLARVG